MPEIPAEAQLRETVAAFDTVQKRVFASMIVHMLQNREHVRDREWIAARFTETTAMALDLDIEAGDAAEGVQRVRDYAHTQMSPIMNAAFGVFVRVAEKMAVQPEGFTFELASQEALSYLAPD